MAVLTYNISPQLKKYLQEIDALRAKIHLYPLPYTETIRQAWEADMERIFWSLSLAQVTVSKKVIQDVLLEKRAKKMLNNKVEVEIANHKRAMDYIKLDWLASAQKVTPETVKKVHEMAGGKTDEKLYAAKKKEIKAFLDYIQTSSEHAVVSAGIAYIQIYDISPFEEGSARAARHMTYLFLYKYGYSFRDVLVIDEGMRADLVSLRKARETTSKGTLTYWLEYFAYIVMVQLKKAYENIQSGQHKVSFPSGFWSLNNRQKQIMVSVARPEAKITNKYVQESFGVSQITASRDLSKLTQMGILLARGRGRSRYYIKGMS